MHRTEFKINTCMFLALLAMLGLYATSAFSSAPSEKSRIEYLLNALDENELIFVCDSGEKPGAWAKEHLREQYYELNPPVATAEEFIDMIGTRSPVTGKSYLIKVRNEPIISAQKWFRNKLAKKEAAGG